MWFTWYVHFLLFQPSFGCKGLREQGWVSLCTAAWEGGLHHLQEPGGSCSTLYCWELTYLISCDNDDISFISVLRWVRHMKKPKRAQSIWSISPSRPWLCREPWMRSIRTAPTPASCPSRWLLSATCVFVPPTVLVQTFSTDVMFLFPVYCSEHGQRSGAAQHHQRHHLHTSQVESGGSVKCILGLYKAPTGVYLNPWDQQKIYIVQKRRNYCSCIIF